MKLLLGEKRDAAKPPPTPYMISQKIGRWFRAMEYCKKWGLSPAEDANWQKAIKHVSKEEKGC